VSLGGVFSQALPINLVHRVERMLVQAGQPMTPSTFFTIWATFAGMGVFLGFVFALKASGILVLYGLAIAFFSAILPSVFLRRGAARRRREIERSLPDALDLLLTAVEAGLGIDAAFAVVTERSKGPLGEIFTDYLRQVGLGRSRRDALSEVANNCGVP